VKIVLIGAGSGSFGSRMIADVLTCRELVGRGVELALVDEDAAALTRAGAFAEKVRRHCRSDVAVSRATDRREALPGARYVIVAVARRRWELWEQDFRVPLAHGYRHCMGENGGPGALFHALRSIDLVLPICRDVEALAPDALLLNFTNPEARVLHAIGRLTGVRAIGLCHGVFSAVEALARYLRRPAERLEVISAGINHFYCVLKVTDRDTGEDLLPRAVAAAAGDGSPACPPLFRRIAQVFGVFTFPSDDHIGEYLAWAHEFTGLKWPFGRESHPVGPAGPAAPPAESRIERCLRSDAPPDEELLRPSGELAVPVICDIELDRGSFREAVNVSNGPRYVENLPADCIVEVPATADAAGVHPMRVGPLPEAFAAMLRPQCAVTAAVTEAYRARSRRLLLQALLLDPLTHSAAAAERVLDEMLELQKDFLPAFE